MTWTYYWATGGHGAQPLYEQYKFGNCQIGCGPVAWAILFGWADRQAAAGNSYWSPRWGIYRQDGGTGANDVAPLGMTKGIRKVIEELHTDVSTFCIAGSGATFPWDMPQAQNYLNPRTGTRVSCHWNSIGIHESRLRRYARDSIRDRGTPAIIGTGWLSHYPVAYGYAWQKRTVRKCFIFCWNETVYDRWFYVNQGWGGSGNGWVSASTWFSGEVYP